MFFRLCWPKVFIKGWEWGGGCKKEYEKELFFITKINAKA